MPVYENERGTYIFNSRDLCMIEHIPELIDAGVDSFKIEGRMKTALYVATVARTYRKAIDDYNAAKKAGKADQANKIIEARRARLAAALPYAEKWYQYDANNPDLVSLLRGLYLSNKNQAKYEEFKAKEAAMKASGK